jgi:hypothetical protein
MARFFTIYKTTNLLNDRYYIGVHITDDPDDDYLGSGKRLKYEVNKYGVENFKKIILDVFDNSNDMFQREVELVNEVTLRDPLCLNLTIGGYGSFVGANKHLNTHSSENQAKRSPFNNPEWREHNKEKIKEWSKKGTNAMNEACAVLREAGWRSPGFTGKRHAPEVRAKINATYKKIGHQQGKKNSRYGACWVYSIALRQSKSISRDELQSHLDSGWQKGRKMKFNNCTHEY